MESPFITSAPIKLDAAGRIDQDTTCISCGYNVRGLSLDSVCPECGTAVGRSFHGDLLRFAPPGWVETLATGMNWILASIVIAVLFACLFAGVGVAVARSAGTLAGRSVWVQFIPQALGIISVIGYWMLTTPDPARAQDEPSITARKLVRFASVFNYVVGLAQVGAARVDPRVAYTLAAAVGLFGIVNYFAVFIYGRQLALRIPNERLASQTRIVMWGMVILAGLTLLTALIGVAGAGAGRRAGGGLAVVMCPASIGMLVFAIWSLVLLIWFRRELSQAALLARQTWARPVQQAVPASFPGARW